MTFVAVPLAALSPSSRWLLDLGHLVFASLCALALTSHTVVRLALLSGLVLLGIGPPVWDLLTTAFRLSPEGRHESISATVFCFNALVTALVARGAFGSGRVTTHRVLGAVLVYLNVAALFAIAFDLLATNLPGAIRATSQELLATGPGARTAELSYFSLTTITSTGYGDLVPVHPLARSIANLEAAFGQLFPAIFVARLVALQLVHGAPPTQR